MDNNILDVVYHNAYGKRNRMIIDLDRFFPCGREWVDKLIRYVILGSDDPAEHLQQIADYLRERYREAEKVNKTDQATPKSRQAEKLYRSCLEFVGGKYGGKYNIITD